LTPQRCAAARELLDELGLHVGDELMLGGQPFEIAAAVLDEPGRLDIGFTPRARGVFTSPTGCATCRSTAAVACDTAALVQLRRSSDRRVDRRSAPPSEVVNTRGAEREADVEAAGLVDTAAAISKVGRRASARRRRASLARRAARARGAALGRQQLARRAAIELDRAVERNSPLTVF